MISKAGKQELAILAAANGGLVSILSGYEIGNAELRKHIENALLHTTTAINEWPGADTIADITWALNRVKSWQKKLGPLNDNNSMSCLVYIAMQSIIDIEERIALYNGEVFSVSRKDAQANQIKLTLLAPILEHVTWADDFLDDKGRQFDEYMRGNNILDVLYTEIDFDF